MSRARPETRAKWIDRIALAIRDAAATTISGPLWMTVWCRHSCDAGEILHEFMSPECGEMAERLGNRGGTAAQGGFDSRDPHLEAQT